MEHPQEQMIYQQTFPSVLHRTSLNVVEIVFGKNSATITSWATFIGSIYGKEPHSAKGTLQIEKKQRVPIVFTGRKSMPVKAVKTERGLVDRAWNKVDFEGGGDLRTCQWHED